MAWIDEVDNPYKPRPVEGPNRGEILRIGAAMGVFAIAVLGLTIIPDIDVAVWGGGIAGSTLLLWQYAKHVTLRGVGRRRE